MSKWLIIWLIFVAGWYLIPWWNRVYFLWDDIELLMQLRNPALSDFLSSHQYQFFPVFKLFYALEIQLLGVNPSAFLLASVILHLTNIILVYKLIVTLTKNHSLGLAAAILVSFNKSYFTVIFWPTIQSNLLLTTFILLSCHQFIKLCTGYRKSALILFASGLLMGGLSFGFGVGTGVIFAIIARAFWNKTAHRDLLISVGLIAGLASILAVLFLSSAEIQKDQVFQLSPIRIFNIIYFTLVGVSQAIISRFLLPGFIPNIHSSANVAVMIALPAAILAFFLYTISAIKNKPALLAPLLLFFSLTIIPYFIASLARSGPGVLGGLAERYIYLPFFAFILSFIYSLNLITNNNSFKISYLKILMISILLVINLGHQVTLYMALNQLFL